MEPSTTKTSQAGGGIAGSALARATTRLRVVGMFLVVLCHSAISYVVTRDPAILWTSYEIDGFFAADLFTNYGHSMAIPLFFVLAGLVGGPALKRVGPKRFLANRAQRLLIPFAVGLVTVLPLTYAVWSYGLQVTGFSDTSQPQRDLLQLDFATSVAHWGPAHLWFLEYLFVISALYVLLSLLAKTLGAHCLATLQRWEQRILASPGRPALIAIPIFFTLTYDSRPWMELYPRFVPHLATLVYYLLYFALGARLAEVAEPERRLTSWAPTYVAISLAANQAVSYYVEPHYHTPLSPADFTIMLALLAVIGAFSIFGLIGCVLRISGRPGRLAIYLAEASFLVYFLHLPVVALLQIELWKFSAPTPVKYLTVVSLTFVLCLGVYQALVRHNRLGALLAGQSRRPSRQYLARAPLRRLGWGMTLAGAVGIAWFFSPMFLNHNQKVVVSGAVYRSAQLDPKTLEKVIARQGIKSVVSLRGGRADRGWYAKQSATCERLGVTPIALRIGAQEMPTRAELLALLKTLEAAPKPVLLHDQWGTDRVALGASLLQLSSGVEVEVAQREFSLRRGYFYPWASAGLHRVIADYADWLVATNQRQSSAVFRHWLSDVYVPDGFGARIEAPAFSAQLKTDAPTPITLAVTNTSRRPWRLGAEPGRGVRLGVKIRLANPYSVDQAVLQVFAHGQARLIAPSETVSLTVEIPPLKEPGTYHAEFDLRFEDRIWFAEKGSPITSMTFVLEADQLAGRRNEVR